MFGSAESPALVAGEGADSVVGSLAGLLGAIELPHHSTGIHTSIAKTSPASSTGLPRKPWRASVGLIGSGCKPRVRRSVALGRSVLLLMALSLFPVQASF